MQPSFRNSREPSFKGYTFLPSQAPPFGAGTMFLGTRSKIFSFASLI